MVEKYDIAIIGGGVAGLYCCMLAYPDQKVALFEATNRIGGRIETICMDKFYAEYGAMRFDPLKQPILGKILQYLELETEPFHEYNSPPVQNRRTIYDLDESEKNQTALDLMRLAIRKVLNRTDEELSSMKEEELEYIRREGKYNGEYLWKQGIWNLFSNVLSFDAIKYIIMEGSFFHFIHENPGVDWMINWIKMFQMSKDLKGIKNGMESLTLKMLATVRNKGIDVYKNHVLIGMEQDEKNVNLFFDNEITFKADHVILAIPPRSLNSIGLPDDIKKLLCSVKEIPLLKCFFIVNDPWWKEDQTNIGIIPIPARELHYRKISNTILEKGSIMVYSDKPYVNFWSRYVKSQYHAQTEIGNNEELQFVFARQMGIDPDKIIMYGIRDWGRPPYGAACHIWKPGIQSWIVREQLEAFSLKGFHQNIHICGEAFSDFQGFIEGSLKSAQSVMTKIQS